MVKKNRTAGREQEESVNAAPVPDNMADDIEAHE